MKVLILGSGGREHALAWKLKTSPKVTEVLSAPGNAGTLGPGRNVAVELDRHDTVIDLVQSEGVDLTVVGPEAPLVAGIVDRFREEGLRIAGPTAAAAQLEGSKVFAKQFLVENDIPTARFTVFESPDAAERALESGSFEFPTVVKADGLAAGKGVLICPDLQAALEAVRSTMRQRDFGTAGDRIVIEEFLEGEETSFMVFTDGERILPMVPSQDHKAILEGDRGPNTGGMGAFSADFLLSGTLREQIMHDIIEPTVQGMAERGTPFQGILYAGLMLTKTGPKVLEFNVRFGDPETQAVLPRLRSDLFEIFWALSESSLSDLELEWSADPAVCVVIVSPGYPGSYRKGFEISGIAMAEDDPETVVFHAGTTLEEGKLVTSGGRVLGVTSKGPDLESAIIKVYEAVNKIHFEGMYYRRDIAAKGLNREKSDGAR